MKTLHSLDELKEEYKEELENEKTLKEYGINVSESDLENIKIISMDDRNLTVKNTKTGEIITSTIYSYFNNRNFDSNIRPHVLIKRSKDGVVEEEYHCFEEIFPKQYSDIKDHCSKNRTNKETLFLKRIYADVETKYGNYCLCLENNLKHTFDGQSTSMALYHGNIDNIECGGFIEPTYFGLLKNTKYFNGFYNMNLGFVNWDFKEHRWLQKNPESPNSYVYASNKHLLSAIIEDASVDLKGDLNVYYDDYLEQYHISYARNYLSNKGLVSKAYFADYDKDMIVIEKDSKFITISHLRNKGHYASDGVELIEKNSFCNISDGKLSFEEIDVIISWLNKYNHICLENIEFIDNVTKELKVYKTLKNNYDAPFNFTNPYALNIDSFDSLAENLRKIDTKELVENIIDVNSSEFNISVDELKGDVSKAEDNFNFVKKLKN